MASADAFFWYVESRTAPQQVGGLALLAHAPNVDRVRGRVAEALPEMRGFARVVEPGTRWRRPRWVDVDEVDLTWHVTDVDLGSGAGGPADLPALHRYVAAQTACPMPLDRPLWRVVVVRGLEDGRGALVVLAHHTIADGLGVVGSVLHFLDPPEETARPPARTGPGRVRRAAVTALGIVQLAGDGFCTTPLGDPRSSGRRDFTVVAAQLEDVRRVARHHRCGVTDVLLCAVAGGLARRQPDLAASLGNRLRVAVPLLAADPGRATGNVTAAVMVDLPLGPLPEPDRLAVITRRTGRLRTPGRVLASRMVMARALAVAPAPFALWFARTVYGRRSFHGIVSNMVGPDRSLRLVDATLSDVVPILPLAPGSPLAVGALGWTGALGIGVATDPAVITAGHLASGMTQALADLVDTSGLAVPEVRRPGVSA